MKSVFGTPPVLFCQYCLLPQFTADHATGSAATLKFPTAGIASSAATAGTLFFSIAARVASIFLEIVGILYLTLVSSAI